MGRVFVAGVGLTKIGDHWTKSLTDLAVEAGFKAIESVDGAAPDQVVVGNMFSSMSSRQEHLGPLVSNGLGLVGVPAFKVEAACASGGAAVNVGYASIKSGLADEVLVVGVEKMRDLEPAEVSEALCMAESAEYTQFFGASFVSLNAMLARLYMHEYDVSREELSAFPVLAHQNAATAEHAQFRKVITYEDVARSALVSDPLRLLDCAPVGDGAAAVLLLNEEKADEYRAKQVEIVGSASATNRFSLYERDDLLDFAATRQATRQALSQAHCALQEMDFIEIHDAFSVVAALSVEAMGLSKSGEGARDARTGKFDRAGEKPLNTFGGLKGRGHPVGATGAFQVAEAYLQLTGRAGRNQVGDATLGLTHNIGGVDTSAAVHVLRKV